VSLAAEKPRTLPGPQTRTSERRSADPRSPASVDDSADARSERSDGVGRAPSAGGREATWSTTRLGAPARQDNRARFGTMVGASPRMREAYERIERVAPTEASVLIVGESGTGKELAAEAVHALSRRSGKPMIAINCGAISATLIESELFGHERGSFTGAGKVHRGHFERADGGTLFLDEISEMPCELQVKLLRVLESGSFFRVGGERPVVASVRIVAAAKPHLERAVAEGRFRADLFYRLEVVPIRLPPLRDRRGDLQLLVEHFLAELNRGATVAKRLSSAAFAFLQSHDWPGNIRELKHALERAFILADTEIGPAELADLPVRRNGTPVIDPPATGAVVLEPGISLADAERALVLATLARTGGNRARAAALLGLSAKALRRRLRDYQEQGRFASADPGGKAGRSGGNGEEAGARGGPYDSSTGASRSGFLATVANK
jgi:two-component system, NtrC family, response regulator AtoC